MAARTVTLEAGATTASGVAAPRPSNGWAADPVALGRVLAESNYFADARDAAKAAVKVMAGQELGFGPIASMTGIHIIEGKPSLGANLMAALVKRSRNYRYVVTELSDERCSIAFHELAGGEWVPCGPESAFTLADAEKAGVGARKNWRQYPRNMLFARALSNGVTWYCPDLTGGAPIYTPEELGADVDGATGQVVGAAVAVPPPPPAAAEIAAPPPPKRAGRITKKRAAEIAGAAFLVGVEGQLQLAASHAHKEDVGDCSTEERAAEALRKLSAEEADRLEDWISKKAEQRAGEES